MLRSLVSFGRLSRLSRRHICTAAESTPPTPSPFHHRVTTMIDEFLDADWVDTEQHKPIELLVEKADNVIHEYRGTYSNETPHDELYDDVATLYFTKEAASICEAFGAFSQRKLRQHEGMLGFFGNNTEIPEGKGEETLELFRDYIAFMDTIEDERIKNKVEVEWGRKMMHLKMFISMENFSVKIAPLAGDSILPVTPKYKKLPEEVKSQTLPSSTPPSDS